MPLKLDYTGEALQGFAPTRIVSTTNFDTSGVLAIRLSASASYTINNTGTTGTMPAGVTVVGENVNTIDFTAPTTIEVMDY